MTTPSVLVAYVSRAGSTKELAEIVAGTLSRLGIAVDLKSVEDVSDLSPYSGVVIGSAIYYGHLMPAAINFLKKYEEKFAEIPLALFSVGAEMRKGTPAARAATEGVVRTSLQAVPGIKPVGIEYFAGALNPDRLGFWSKLVMKLMKGEAGDWKNPEAVRKWAEGIAPLLGGTSEP